ncbi:Retrotransposon gag protein [Gossypium australe]|uniref:Retrotransposon gag protein n=1 Tax=Gossypium australe TaxID=47621 RepID=A0A5B6X4B2_9ROSI|nr:Retrotransposon gag protein [Gossypium australe]
MSQNTLRFKGNMVEDPNQHLKKFLQLYDIFKYNGVFDDVVRLQLFPFSLCNNAADWLNSLELDLAEKFLYKIFSISQTIQLRREIVNFKEYEGESLYEAWEHFNTMLRKCPHQLLQAWLQIQIFYNSVDGHIRSNLDKVAGGSLMFYTYEQA